MHGEPIYNFNIIESSFFFVKKGPNSLISEVLSTNGVGVDSAALQMSNFLRASADACGVNITI